jgi:uncharacterized protein YegP (UPF0339 family)
MTPEPLISRVLVYRDSAGEWRATMYARNHEAVFVTSEGYTNRGDVVDVCQRAFPDAEISDGDVPA